MLPTGAFAEAVAFLRLFDLSALAIANSLCASFAVKASTKIRWEEFPGLCFNISPLRIHIYDVPEDEDPSFHQQFVATLSFASENDMTEFVAAAFPNCIVADVMIYPYLRRKGRLWDAIGQAADSVVVKGALRLPGSISHLIAELFETVACGGTDRLDYVVDNYYHAITARFPRSRYACGWDALFIHVPISFLPTELQDFVVDWLRGSKNLPAVLEKEANKAKAA